MQFVKLFQSQIISLTIGFLFSFLFSFPAHSEGLSAGPLTPVKTESPRDTMRTFYESMNRYKATITKDPEKAKSYLDRAIRTLNVESESSVLPGPQGREAAIFLKEVIDRIIVLNFDYIPLEIKSGNAPWRLKDTEISIAKVKDGDRQGQYLFTKDTVQNARTWYDRVKDLPYLPGSGMGAGYQEPWLKRHVPSWTQNEFLFFYNWQWIGIFISIFLGLLARLIGTILSRVCQRLTKRLGYRWWNEAMVLTERPLGLAAASLLWFFSIHVLAFEGRAYLVLRVVNQLIFSISMVWAFYKLVDVLSEYLMEKAKETESTLDDHIMPLVQKSLRSFTIIFGVLLVFQNLGVNVMSVLAGLGLGGLAFALAAKDTCANFFGSIMILMDRPFKIGDWININGVDGTVEEIGFRSTRLRTFYNSMVSIPNSSVVNANIDNYGRREFRRIYAKLGLTYDTPPEKVEGFCEGIKKILQANEYIRQDYFHVVFNSYQADNLEILVYCFLKVPDWSAELVERQNIYLEILRLAQDLQVEFAFPTQTLHVESFPGKEPKPESVIPGAKELHSIAESFGPKGSKSMPAGQGIYTPSWRE